MVQKLARRSPLAPADIDALHAPPCQHASWDRGDYLFREGDNAAHCIALLSGFAYRGKIAGYGARQILSIHKRGNVVDLQNSLLDQADLSVQAPSDYRGGISAVGRALWRDTLVDALMFREWILNLGQRTARQRISHLLCEGCHGRKPLESVKSRTGRHCGQRGGFRKDYLHEAMPPDRACVA